jgi:hypothetical protein
MTARGRGVLTAGLVMVATVSCAESADEVGDTLAPLPVSGPTTPPLVVTTSSPNGAPIPAATVAATLDTDPQLVGDWDGAEFDVGVIDRVGELGGYRTIEFDRYSYRDPERGVIDAGAFTDEPIAYGWRDSPFVNIEQQLRTFVVADDVEVLVLGGDATARCRGRAPPPRATWLSVEPSYLDLPAATEDIASLTYSPAGQVVRIRFTRGCAESD